MTAHRLETVLQAEDGRSYLPVNRALREAAGVAAGDAVVVELEGDDQPRTVDPPPDLAAATPSRCAFGPRAPGRRWPWPTR